MRSVHDEKGARVTHQTRSPKARLPLGVRILAIVPTFAFALLACLCALTGVLALCAPASALEAHVFSTSFNGGSEHALSEPRGLAVDQSSGDVYVVDAADDRVEIFEASGTFVKAFGAKGTGDGQFTEPTEVAVDNSGGITEGDVYVIDGGHEGGANRVEIFNADGEYKSQITRTEVEAPLGDKSKGIALSFVDIDGVGLDAAGNLWLYIRESAAGTALERPAGGSLRLVFSSPAAVGAGFAVTVAGDSLAGNGSGVTQRGPNGEELEGIGFGESPGLTGVAVDPATGDVYLDRGSEVAHFPAPTSGFEYPSDLFGSSGPDPLLDGTGIAVDGASGELYVADTAAKRVDAYRAVTQATVSLEAATNVAETAATLNGTVNPSGVPVSACQFEYGTEQGVYPHAVACSPDPGSGTEPVTVSASLSALTPGATYFYRLSATDANGTNYDGEEGAFATPVNYALAINATGTGVVECEVENSGRLEPCAAEYDKGTSLTLKGVPGPGATFEGWSSPTGSAASCAGLEPCEFRIREATAITATFSTVAVTEYPLELKLTGTGAGTLECEARESGHFEACAAEYPAGTKLALKAQPDAGSTFTQWSTGACEGSSEPECRLTINAPVQADAVFTKTPLPKYLLDLSVSGEGEVGSQSGTVACRQGGSPVECDEQVEAGSTVTLKATAAAGSHFEGWTQGPCALSRSETCEFVMPGEELIARRVIRRQSPAAADGRQVWPGDRHIDEPGGP